MASSHTDLGAPMLPEGIEPFMTLEAGTALIACTGHMDKRGFEVVLPGKEAAGLWDSLIRYGVPRAGLGAPDLLRLEAVLNFYGNEIDSAVIH